LQPTATMLRGCLKAPLRVPSTGSPATRPLFSFLPLTSLPSLSSNLQHKKSTE
uniref:Uncharacterized protein n=1 Tax=Aegilops tauschii subsp. strangulata TaxID=200361 RepID=A0A453LQW3_AEGTS